MQPLVAKHFRERIKFQTKFLFSLTDSDCGIFALRVNPCFVNSQCPAVSICGVQHTVNLHTLSDFFHFFNLNPGACLCRTLTLGRTVSYCVTIVCDFVSIICMHAFTYSVLAKGSISEYLPYGNKWRSYKKLRL